MVDHAVSGDRVSLDDGENTKPVPVTLIRSTVPKLARSFAIRLRRAVEFGSKNLGFLRFKKKS